MLASGADALEQLFTLHGAASFDKQVYLRAQFGQAGWAFDLESGVLAFRRPHEPLLQLQAQVLGTESAQAGTWLWGWANTQSRIPERLLSIARQMQQLGEMLRVPALLAPELELSESVSGDRLSLIAVGVARAAAHFRAAYPGGALFLIIKDGRYPRRIARPVRRVARLFPAFLARYTVADARAALKAYLHFYRLQVVEDGAHVIGEHRWRDTLSGQERIERVSATFAGQQLASWEYQPA
ncbi:MAG: DUF6882 domain-containing protein [Thermoflexales bacterium]